MEVRKITVESERIANLSELEQIIQTVRANVIYLKKAIKDDNKDASIHLAEQLDLKLHQMEAFNFNIERRTITIHDIDPEKFVDKERKTRQMEERKIFVPKELKTVEIDVEKKIFRVNGEDFGQDCTGFSLDCDPKRSGREFYRVCMDITSDIRFRANYDAAGNKTGGGFGNE